MKNDSIVIKYEKGKDIKEYNGKNKNIELLGEMLFFYEDEGLSSIIIPIEVPKSIQKDESDEYLKFFKHLHLTKNISDIFTGKDFFKDVKDGCITDYDGHILNIYVDGYISNLGLITENLCQGKFLVDEKVFEMICENHEVLVDWANK